MLTQDQRDILCYFFTTAEGRVACATDNMPSSLWAFLVGAYSRTHEPIRVRLLNALFKDASLDVASFANAVRSQSNDYLSGCLDTAAKFLSKWAVDYGHNSLKDSSIDRFAVEGCSIYATKAFQDSELGAYQEKSTRYLPFSVESVDDLALPSAYLKDGGTIEPTLRAALVSTFEAYEAVLGYWSERHYAESNPSDFVNDAARVRTARAKAFDKARYYLPVCSKTSFGATIQTRETAALLCRMLAHPSSEVREIASEVLTEVRKVNPGLFTRIDPDYAHGHLDLPSLGGAALFPDACHIDLDDGEYTQTYEDVVRYADCGDVGAHVYLTHSTGLREHVAAAFYSFAARRSGVRPEHRQASSVVESYAGNVNALSRYGSETINSFLSAAAKHYAQVRSSRHSNVPRYLDHVHVTFDVVMDYGAFRDLQRHRAGKQDIATFLSSIGVIEFPEFDTMPGPLKEACRKAVAALRKIRTELSGTTIESQADADYLHLLGHPVSWTYTCSLRQLVYLTELRSQPSGHVSYRAIAQAMARLVETEIDWLFPYLDRSDITSRASAENAIQEKIARIS